MKIKKLDGNAILPRYSTDGASAFDVFAMSKVKWKRKDGHWEALIGTGWVFEIPEEYGLFILSRSGHGFNFNTSLSNSVGLLDYDYRGQLMVKLICFDEIYPTIVAGQAIAQCVLLHTPRQEFNVVDTVTDTVRGEDGFGSTDKLKGE